MISVLFDRYYISLLEKRASPTVKSVGNPSLNTLFDGFVTDKFRIKKGSVIFSDGFSDGNKNFQRTVLSVIPTLIKFYNIKKTI